MINGDSKMNEIVRRPDFAGGGITDEEKAQMDAMAERYINDIILRTEPADINKLAPAIRSLYAAADLDSEVNVVLVSSPLQMAFVYGAAAWIWHCRGADNDGATAAATDAATLAATHAATYDATLDATYAATRAATNAATDAATLAATHAATRAATDAATLAATATATFDATDDATHDATRDATHDATATATEAATRDATRAATVDATYAATYAATRDATRAATRDATYAATYAATRDATAAATRVATHVATRDATYAATRDATRAATHDATDAATDAATRDATYSATRIAKQYASTVHAIAGEGAIKCAANWYRAYQGGAMWAQWDCYLAAGRDVLGLELDEHKTFAAWEACHEGGFRCMHERFCVVSDHPVFIHRDENNQPHCETGPSHLWRDGWALYHWHGVKVPAHWIEDPDSVDPVEVLKSENVEERAAGAEIIGWSKMLTALDAKVIDDSGNPDIGELIELTLPGLPEPGRFLKAHCPRNGIIVEGVPYESDIDGLPIDTAIAAQAWRIGDPQSEYQHPPVRT